MRRRRREHVARVEGARDLGQAVALVRELVRRVDTELVRREHQQPVVRADEQPPVGGGDGDRAAISADAGVDDREVHADRLVARRVAQDERALEDGLRLDAVRDVDDAHVGRDARDHPVTRPDEVVLQPEVGEEGDDGHGADFIRSRTAATSPARSCVAASAATRRPHARATRLVSGPIVTAGSRATDRRRRRGPPSRTRARRRPRPAVPASGAGCGTAARSPRRARRSGPGGRLRRRRRAPGLRVAGTRAAGRPGTTRAARTPARCRAARSASAVPGPTAATAGRLRPRAASSSAPFGLVTITQS